jgi:RAB protein geranylgeranyltransferase component A
MTSHRAPPELLHRPQNSSSFDPTGRANLRFVSITPLYAPTSPGTSENIFITKSYDATSHFETVVDDVFDVWQRVKGEPLVLKKREVEVEA